MDFIAFIFTALIIFIILIIITTNKFILFLLELFNIIKFLIDKLLWILDINVLGYRLRKRFKRRQYRLRRRVRRLITPRPTAIPTPQSEATSEQEESNTAVNNVGVNGLTTVINLFGINLIQLQNNILNNITVNIQTIINNSLLSSNFVLLNWINTACDNITFSVLWMEFKVLYLNLYGNLPSIQNWNNSPELVSYVKQIVTLKYNQKLLFKLAAQLEIDNCLRGLNTRILDMKSRMILYDHINTWVDMNINKFINTLSLGLKNNLSGARNTVVKYNFNNRRILNNNFNINIRNFSTSPLPRWGGGL